MSIVGRLIEGIPVTTPAAVDRILLYGNDDDGERPSPAFLVWLYTVDIWSYRTSAAWALQSASPTVVWKEETPNTIIAPVALLSPPSPLVTNHRIPLDVDWNTLHVHIAQNTATTKQIRHAKLMHRCLQALNQGMENRMRLLEHSCEEKPMHTTDVDLTERRRDTVILVGVPNKAEAEAHETNKM